LQGGDRDVGESDIDTGRRRRKSGDLSRRSVEIGGLDVGVIKGEGMEAASGAVGKAQFNVDVSVDQHARPVREEVVVEEGIALVDSVGRIHGEKVSRATYKRKLPANQGELNFSSWERRRRGKRGKRETKGREKGGKEGKERKGRRG